MNITKNQIPQYVNLGLINHGVKGNMWKVQGSNGEDHYISAHLNPMAPFELPIPNTILLMCSCKSFTIGIPAKNINPFTNPCRHIQGFNVKEVDIEKLECNG